MARIKTLGRSFAAPIHGVDEVTLLGHGEPLVFRREDDALVVELPEKRPSEFGLALRITLTRPEPQLRHRWLHN